MNAVRDELLTRARNLERYPFESATMAEAGKLAAVELRKIAREMGDTLKPDAPKAFTNAEFACVTSKLLANMSRKVAELAYGMWNERYGALNVAAEAHTFFEALEVEAAHWKRRAAIAMAPRQRRNAKTLRSLRTAKRGLEASPPNPPETPERKVHDQQ